MDKITSRLFAFFASVFVLLTLVDSYPLSWLVKLLPIVILIYSAYAVLKSEWLSDKHNMLFMMGLFFSGAGDFFLDFDRENLFIFGLGSFFIAHLCYIFSLQPVEMKHRFFIGLYAVFGLGMFTVISAGLGTLFIPVLAYMTILLLMAITTLVSKKSNPFLLIGGLSFVISDSLIGIDKFYLTIPYASTFIMVSYYLAQYMLLNGFLEENKKAARCDVI